MRVRARVAALFLWEVLTTLTTPGSQRTVEGTERGSLVEAGGGARALARARASIQYTLSSVYL